MTGHVKALVIYLPLLDNSGLFGLTLTHILNIIDTYMSAIVFVPFEMIMYLVIANIMLNSAVITRDIDDLKVALLNPENCEREKWRRLLEIIQSLQTFIG